MSLPVYVNVNPINDVVVTDETLLTKREGKMFEEINYSLIKENTQELMDNLALKLFNTVMAEDTTAVVESIKLCKKRMERELSKKAVSLVFCRNKDELLGTILAESVMQFLINGVYSFNRLIPDNIYDALVELFVKGRSEYIPKIKELLKNAYKQDSRNRCVTIISELIKMEYDKSVNILGSIKQYFFFEDIKLFSEIESMVRKGGS